MRLGSGEGVILLPATFQGRPMLGDQTFTAQNAIGWLTSPFFT